MFEQTVATKKRGGKKTLNPNRAIGYIRASTDEQVITPEGQARALRAYAEKNKLEIVAFLSDNASGASELDARDGLMQAIDQMRDRDAGVLLVWKRDRIARDMFRAMFVERLIEKMGGRVVTSDGIAGGIGPEEKLLRQMLDAFSEYERMMIRMRTKNALATKRENGERIGAIPYGYKVVGKRLVPEPTEQSAVVFIVNARAEGKTWEEITADVQRAGYPPRGASGKWHRTSVTRIFEAWQKRRARADARASSTR